ncbi:hypothetical protein A2U01_0111023, partial [Trifolium medium]|nr:hypothetical protein [Trifolium medium]
TICNMARDDSEKNSGGAALNTGGERNTGGAGPNTNPR